MSGLAFGLALLLVAQDAAAPDGRAPAPPGLSWEEADTVARTLRRIDRRLRTGRPASDETLVVTERQLNSFLNLTLAERIPEEVSQLQLRLERGRLGASALLDLDRLREKLPEGGPYTLLSMLSGTVPVQLLGRVDSAEGLVRLDLEEAVVGGVGFPPSLLAQIVSFATRNEKHPEGVDIAAPLALPWTARRVRLERGRALFDFY
jgi:hypothetical protein